RRSRILVPTVTPRYNSALIFKRILQEFVDMSFTAADKAQIVATYQRTKGDTGSPEVQIALLTGHINDLTQHMKVHRHDFHTRYGLTRLVSRRRRMMAYLKRINLSVYRDLLQKLE